MLKKKILNPESRLILKFPIPDFYMSWDDNERLCAMKLSHELNSTSSGI